MKSLIACYVVLAIGLVAYLVTGAAGWLILSAFPGSVLYIYHVIWFVHDSVAISRAYIREFIHHQSTKES